MKRLLVGLLLGVYAVAVALGYLLPLILPRVEAISSAFLLGVAAGILAFDLLDRLERK